MNNEILDLPDLTCPCCHEPTERPGEECRPCRADAVQQQTLAAIRAGDELIRQWYGDDVWWY